MDSAGHVTLPAASPSIDSSNQATFVYWDTDLETIASCIPEVQVFVNTAGQRVDQYRAFALSQKHHGRKDLNMSLARVQRQLLPAPNDLTYLQTSLSKYITHKESVAQGLVSSSQATSDSMACSKVTTLNIQLEKTQAAAHTVSRPLMAFGPVMTKVIAEMTEHWHYHGHDGFMDILSGTWYKIRGHNPAKHAPLYERANDETKAYMHQVFEESRQFVVDSEKLSLVVQNLQNALAEDRLALRLVQSAYCLFEKK